jgi:hypothetical protein
MWALAIVMLAAFAAAPVWGTDTTGERDGCVSNDVSVSVGDR